MGMNFVKIANCWINLNLVESIEVSRTPPEDSREQYTIVVNLGSGRTWSRRDVDKAAFNECISKIDAAVTR
jgi:hypothetical protein